MIKFVKNDFFIYCKEARLESQRSFYGSFCLGPFEAGQSITIANALRRTLLSELKGLAITSAEIEGAFHEYATLPGVRDSILDILLNLKDIVLKSINYGNKKRGTSYAATFKNEQIGYLKTRGPGIVTASDLKLPPGIQCVDPDQYIATLSEEGILMLRININEGKNYHTEQQSYHHKQQYEGNSYGFTIIPPTPSNIIPGNNIHNQTKEGKTQVSLAKTFKLNNMFYSRKGGIKRLWLKKIKTIQTQLNRQKQRLKAFSVGKINNTFLKELLLPSLNSFDQPSKLSLRSIKKGSLPSVAGTLFNTSSLSTAAVSSPSKFNVPQRGSYASLAQRATANTDSKKSIPVVGGIKTKINPESADLLENGNFSINQTLAVNNNIFLKKAWSPWAAKQPVNLYGAPKVLMALSTPLAIDAVFMPVNKVNYIIEINEQSVIAKDSLGPLNNPINFTSKNVKKTLPFNQEVAISSVSSRKFKSLWPSQTLKFGLERIHGSFFGFLRKKISPINLHDNFFLSSQRTNSPFFYLKKKLRLGSQDKLSVRSVAWLAYYKPLVRSKYGLSQVNKSYPDNKKNNIKKGVSGGSSKKRLHKPPRNFPSVERTYPLPLMSAAGGSAKQPLSLTNNIGVAHSRAYPRDWGKISIPILKKENVCIVSPKALLKKKNLATLIKPSFLRTFFTRNYLNYLAKLKIRKPKKIVFGSLLTSKVILSSEVTKAPPTCDSRISLAARTRFLNSSHRGIIGQAEKALYPCNSELSKSLKRKKPSIGGFLKRIQKQTAKVIGSSLKKGACYAANNSGGNQAFEKKKVGYSLAQPLEKSLNFSRGILLSNYPHIKYPSIAPITSSHFLPSTSLKVVNFKTLKGSQNFKTSLKNNIILEIWTNGSIHPRQALYDACKNLLSIFSKLEKARFTRSIFQSEKTYGQIALSKIAKSNVGEASLFKKDFPYFNGSLPFSIVNKLNQTINIAYPESNNGEAVNNLNKTLAQPSYKNTISKSLKIRPQLSDFKKLKNRKFSLAPIWGVMFQKNKQYFLAMPKNHQIAFYQNKTAKKNLITLNQVKGSYKNGFYLSKLANARINNNKFMASSSTKSLPETLTRYYPLLPTVVQSEQATVRSGVDASGARQGTIKKIDIYLKQKQINWNIKLSLADYNILKTKPELVDIGKLNISLRPYTCLKRANINTLKDLLKKSKKELLTLKNFGKQSLKEVEDILEQLGLSLTFKV